MNNKGFTLIELISVLVILGILALIAFPAILSSVNKSQDDLDKNNKELIISNAKTYVNDKQDKFIKSNGNVYCIKLSTLYNEGYTKTVVGIKAGDAVLITDAVKVEYKNDKFNYSYVELTTCSGQTY